MTEPIPTISCGEHNALQTLPPYPSPSGISPADYSQAQALWAIKSAGVYKHNKIIHDSTAECMDNYRRLGVIL